MMALRDWWRTRQTQRQRQRERAQAFDLGVEAVVDRVDPRLRGLSDYHSRLLPALQQAVSACDRLIDSLPAPVEVAPARWSADAHLRAFFASPERLRETFEQSYDLRDFLASSQAQGANGIYGSLSRRMDRRTTLQPVLNGDIQREEEIVTVGFSEHRLGAFAVDPAGFQRALRRRMLEEIALRAAQRIVGLTGRRDALAEQQARLQWKRKMYQMRRDGIGGLRSGSAPCDRHIAELDRQIDDNASDLDQLLARAGSIDDFLDITVDAFARTGETIRLAVQPLCLDHLNREAVAENRATARSSTMQLAELRIGRRRPGIVQPVRFSSSEFSVDVGRALRRAARALGV